MIYLGNQSIGLNIPQDYQVVTGTFIGDDLYAHGIPCLFKPDVYIVWTDEITSNPGKIGLLSVTEMRAKRMLSYRYNSSTSSGTLGGSNSYSGDYYASSYANGVLTVCAGRDDAFRFYDGVTYKYFLAKKFDE